MARALKETLALIKPSLEAIKTSLASKEVVVDTLKVSEVPARIREIVIEKYVIYIYSSTLGDDTLTVSSNEESKTCVLKNGRVTVKFKKPGNFRIMGSKGDYEDITVAPDSYYNEVGITRKNVTLFDDGSDDETIKARIVSTRGKNIHSPVMVLKRDGQEISSTSQIVENVSQFTKYEYSKNSTYTVEYQILGERRGSVTINVLPILKSGSAEDLTKELNVYPSHIVFTDQQAPESASISDWSEKGDSRIVKWYDSSSETFYISSQQSGRKILLPPECNYLFTSPNILSGSGSIHENDKTVSIDFSCVDTSEVLDMSHMFMDCPALQSLDLQSFNTENVQSMEWMFGHCRSLQSIDFSSFNTEKVTSMMRMFDSCENLTNLNLESFNGPQLVTASDMFMFCSSLQTINLKNFATPKLYNAQNMVYRCTSLESIDLSNLDLSNATKTDNMFDGDRKLTTIYATEWVNNKREDLDSALMFTGCRSLPNFNTLKVDIENAKWSTNGGYLTQPEEA